VALLIVSLAVALEYPRAEAVFAQKVVRFVDSDDYMRVYRAKQVAAGHALVIGTMPEVDAPRGAELHWTAPMDWLLALAGKGFGGVTGGTDRFDGVAACVPIVMGAAYLLILVMLINRAAGSLPACLAGIFVALSPGFHRAFGVGHPDHQCLMEFLMLCGMASLYPREVARATGSRAPWGAAASGLAFGLAIWVAVQCLVPWFAMWLGLVIAARRGDANAREAYGRWCVGCVAAVIVGFAVERSAGTPLRELDKIGGLSVALIVGVSLLGTRLISRANTTHSSRERVSPRMRLAVIGLGILMLGTALTSAVVPDASFRPLRYVNSPEFVRWSSMVAELQPLVSTGGSASSLAPMHAMLGFAPFALPILLVPFLRSSRAPLGLKMTATVLSLALTVLAIAQRRWLDHVNLGLAPVIGIGLGEFAGSIRRRAAGVSTRQACAIVIILLGVIVFPAAKGLFGRHVAGERSAMAAQYRTSIAATCIREFERQNASEPGRRTILCDDGDGPQLLFETGLPIVASPYHRALDGLLDAARFFAERRSDVARNILDARQVRYIVTPFRGLEQLVAYERIVFGDLRSFDVASPRGAPRPRPEIAETMVYRLAANQGPAISGVRMIGQIPEDPAHPERMFGLVYVVDETQYSPP